MDNKYKDFIIAKILAESGIVIAPVHTIGVFTYVDKLLKSKCISAEDYCRKLDTDKQILSDLINHATTNETYFFREEKQFDYLEKEFFPKYKNKKITIWSAACSTGEEPLSLLAMALHFNVNIEIYASDIDDNVLNFFKKGIYSKYSFRNDGKKYHKYITELGSFNENKTLFKFRQDILNKIKIFKYNLTDLSNFPFDIKFDIIFMRNVFIYFDYETRRKITERVTKELNVSGHLFYSINEIGNINKKIVPDYMKKINYEQIYFYIKQNENDNCKIDVLTNKDNLTPDEVFKSILVLLQKNQCDEAFKIASDYKPVYSHSYYSSFFKGYILMAKNDYSEAERYFTTSEFMKEKFWPVYYFHGLLLEKINAKEKALVYYRKCIDNIQTYIENKEHDYDFLLKGVKPSFIYSYCLKAIKEKINGV